MYCSKVIIIITIIIIIIIIIINLKAFPRITAEHQDCPVLTVFATFGP